jgi:hypothetical protein
MSLITPSDHREAILKKGYRCISHLWGNATRWEDHPIKDVSWGVDVRKNKRDKLLQILNHFKGYWWMDVFCTDQDSNNKPLSIMGDVYIRPLVRGNISRREGVFLKKVRSTSQVNFVYIRLYHELNDI